MEETTASAEEGEIPESYTDEQGNPYYLDENYVDENGQVVMQNNGDTDNAQNTDSSQPADNAQSTDNSQAAANAQNPDTSQETSNSAEQTSLTVAPPIAATQKAVEYSLDKLNDFDYLVQNFYQVDSTTTVKSDQLNVAALTGKNMKIAHDAGTPQILIYHTHSLEGYADSIPGDRHVGHLDHSFHRRRPPRAAQRL